MLKETLPRKPDGKDALVRRINERHQRKHDAIQSRFRTVREPAAVRRTLAKARLHGWRKSA